MKNPSAVALGQIAKGVPKTLTQEQRTFRAQQREDKTPNMFDPESDLRATKTTKDMKMSTQITETKKATRCGVRAALKSMGYTEKNELLHALRNIEASADFTDEDMQFARYLIYDTDFGGAWNDDDQINYHCA